MTLLWMTFDQTSGNEVMIDESTTDEAFSNENNQNVPVIGQTNHKALQEKCMYNNTSIYRAT